MKLVLFLALILATTIGHASDRVNLVQSKINGTLAGILDKNDYIVIVNRMDQLDDFSMSQSTSGSVRSLPGLNVGVDEKGQVVKQDADTSSYTGDVSISIILDKAVKDETYKTIEKMIPEMAGGLRDGDEIRMSKSQLRQALRPNESPVTVNNITQPDNFSYSESLKFIALLMIGAGLFAWILGKVLSSNSGNKKPENQSSPNSPQEQKQTPHEKVLEALDLTELSPESTALYLLKCLKDNNLAPFTGWFELAPVSFQRKMFMELPAWTASHMQTVIKKTPFSEEPVSADTIYREISILEQTLKYSSEKERYFLSWFPAQSLRHVPKQFQKNVSDESRTTLWYLRPELGDFVKVESLGANEISQEPTQSHFAKTYNELKSWPSTAFSHEIQVARTVVDSWATMINSLSEFSPIESQVLQAKEKLNAEQFAELQKKVVSAETPLHFSPEKLKHWLLLVDPADYQWWLSVTKTKPTWELNQILRPMRIAMFTLASQDQAFLNWPESEKKAAASRILSQLRQVHLDEILNDAMAA